jgi:hypothetical protein
MLPSSALFTVASFPLRLWQSHNLAKSVPAKILPGTKPWQRPIENRPERHRREEAPRCRSRQPSPVRFWNFRLS